MPLDGTMLAEIPSSCFIFMMQVLYVTLLILSSWALDVEFGRRSMCSKRASYIERLYS